MQNCLSTVWTDEWLCIPLKTCSFTIELPFRTFIEMSIGQQWTRLIAQGIALVKKGANTSECEDDSFITNWSTFQWTSWQVWLCGIFPSLGADSSPSPYFAPRTMGSNVRKVELIVERRLDSGLSQIGFPKWKGMKIKNTEFSFEGQHLVVTF